ncbi:hypothetical protein SEA_DUMPTRUCK_79 [Gordonia phage DumpTruck]|nr:hypothetical protein SEA_DUMPTRUCK_79 [Gordonia phage DumpTruck]
MSWVAFIQTIVIMFFAYMLTFTIIKEIKKP